MTKNCSPTGRWPALRANTLLVLLVLGAGAAASVSGVASCGNQPYYESQTAARTAYEAAESARRAADAATVAAIELRLSNDRLGESADKLRNVITGEGFAQRIQPSEPAAQIAPTAQPPSAQSAAPQPQVQPTQTATPAEQHSDSPGGVLPILQHNSAAIAHNADAAAALTKAQQDLTDATKSLTSVVKSGGTDRSGRDIQNFRSGDDAQEEAFDLDLAFAATAFLALVVIAWWGSSARAQGSRDERAADWVPVSSAACAAMVSIALAGTAYFGMRVYRAGGTDEPLWNMPWQVMAWVWCAMVAVGLLVMWVSALTHFWHRLGDRIEPAPAAANDRSDMWRLWMSILAVGALPAAGLLLEGRVALLLALLLVVVFGVFSGMAMLAAARGEARTPPKRTVV